MARLGAGILHKYDLTTQGDNKLSEHFKVSEFKSYSSSKQKLFSNEVLVYSGLVDALEKLIDYLNADACTIINGYRCKEHNKAIGGASNSTHLYGYAADVCVYKKSRSLLIPIDGKVVCCAAETLGFAGIGYMANNHVHLDVSPLRRWYGDETKKENKTYYSLSKHGKSFYDYFNIARPTDDEVNDEVVEKRSIMIFGKTYEVDGIFKDDKNYISPKVFADAGLEVSSYGDEPVITTGMLKVKIDGKEKSVSGFNTNGTTYCGIRVLAEALGYTVNWDGNAVVLTK